MIEQLPKSTPDPLLVSVKLGTIVIRIVLLIAMLVALIGLAINLFDFIVPLMGFPDPPLDNSAATSGALIAMFLIAIAALGMMVGFFGRLSGIIGTIGQGDPFTSENADRLQRMGWLALFAQALAAPLAALADRLGPEHVPPGIGSVFSFSFVGLVLTLAIFALARVFRKGAEMREDLEGTV